MGDVEGQDELNVLREGWADSLYDRWSGQLVGSLQSSGGEAR